MITMTLNFISTQKQEPTEDGIYLVGSIGFIPYRLIYENKTWINPVSSKEAKVPDYWAELPVIPKGFYSCEYTYKHGVKCGCQATHNLEFCDGSDLNLCKKHVAAIKRHKKFGPAVVDVCKIEEGGING